MPPVGLAMGGGVLDLVNGSDPGPTSDLLPAYPPSVLEFQGRPGSQLSTHVPLSPACSHYAAPIPGLLLLRPTGCGGGGYEGKKKFVYRNIGLSFLAPHSKFHFSPEEIFFGFWVGGWVVVPGWVGPPDPPPPPRG